VEPDQHAPSNPAPRAAGRPVSHWLFEGLFIVLSVLLGFGVAQYGDYRNDQELARRMLTSIRTESEYNNAALDKYLPFHQAWRDRLQNIDAATATGSTLEVFVSARPETDASLAVNVPVFRRAAWDTAISTGALRLIDYDLAAGLSEIYGMQQHAIGTFMGLFAQASFYDPASRAATIQLARTALQEMTWAEGQLRELYDKHLPAIRRAAGDR